MNLLKFSCVDVIVNLLLYKPVMLGLYIISLIHYSRASQEAKLNLMGIIFMETYSRSRQLELELKLFLSECLGPVRNAPVEIELYRGYS